jgi:hypothetical protein
MTTNDNATITNLGRGLFEMGVPLPRRSHDLAMAWIDAFAEQVWLMQPADALTRPRATGTTVVLRPRSTAA